MGQPARIVLLLATVAALAAQWPTSARAAPRLRPATRAGTALGGELCTQQDDPKCKADRPCTKIWESNDAGYMYHCGEGKGTTCVCYTGKPSDVKCEKSADCDEGEHCFVTNFIADGAFCMSCNADFEDFLKGGDNLKAEPVDASARACLDAKTAVSPTPAPAADDGDSASETTTAPTTTAATATEEQSSSSSSESSDLCVDARLLAHLPRHALVFRAHRRAHVLCDAHGTCATPGHLVEWMSAPMLMRTYCATAGVSCTRAALDVNSPRMMAGLRIATHTPGLTVTPLAARFAMRVEERVLRVVARFF